MAVLFFFFLTVSSRGTQWPLQCNRRTIAICQSLHTGQLNILAVVWEDDLKKESFLQSKVLWQIHILMFVLVLKEQFVL